jgi:hypothetical protein
MRIAVAVCAAAFIVGADMRPHSKSGQIDATLAGLLRRVGSAESNVRDVITLAINQRRNIQVGQGSASITASSVPLSTDSPSLT